MQIDGESEPMFVAGGRGGIAGRRRSVSGGELVALKELLENAVGFDRIRYAADSACALRGGMKLGQGRVPKTRVGLRGVV